MTRFEKYGNVMIDLETLSTHNNAAIIEIGAVEFNKYTGEIGNKLDIIINTSDWCKNGRHVDGETIKWWLGQSETARNRFIKKQEDAVYLNLRPSLVCLENFINECGEGAGRGNSVVVWGNGATMDIAILESAYNYFDLPIPWKYWSVNDVRTIVDLNPCIKTKCKFTSGVKHSAVSDCLHEIKYTVETIKSLTEK